MMLLPSISRASRATVTCGLKARRQVHELRGRARVHAELIDDGDAARGHAPAFSALSRSDATQMALRP